MKNQARTENGSVMTIGDKEMQEEMVGVLTAISIVSKRLANRLSQLDNQAENRKKCTDN